MGKVISVLNMKGGVGKTTLTLNLGTELERKNYRVLIIDLDPQSSLTQFHFGVDQSVELYLKNKPTITSVFEGQYEGVVYKLSENLHIIPSSLRLSKILSEPADIVILGFSDFILGIKERYDYVLIDCPPFESVLNRSTYNVSDFILNPVLISKFAILGLYLLTDSMTKYCRLYKKSLRGGTVINAFDYNNESYDQIQLLETISSGVTEMGGNDRLEWDLFKTKIAYSKSHLKSINDGTSLRETKYCRFDVKSNFGAFVTELLRIV